MATPRVKRSIHTDAEFLKRLQIQVEEAAGSGRQYTVLACIPQHLPGEDVSDVVSLATECLLDLVRDDDLAGRVGDDVLAVGLHETDFTGARIFGQRLQSDLGRRSAGLRAAVWETGIARLPEDGMISRKLLDAAIDAARNRRRRLGTV